MDGVTPQPGIMEIALYKGGESRLPGREDVLKLSSNENPHGPGSAAVEAFRATAPELHRYPSTDHGALRGAIAEVFELDAERIICGVGSDEIIAFLCQAYVGPGDEVIHTEHSFAMYRISTLAAGGTPVEVSEAERHTDVDAILAGVTEATKLVFVANPNNPTSTMVGVDEIERLADALPPHVILVLDGAYAEFVPGFDGGAALVEARENVVMTRTFSKLYGLGGLRVGWGYGPTHVIDVLNRIRGPFNLSETQLVTAEAAVRDTAHATWSQEENIRARAYLSDGLRGLGLLPDESQANFVVPRFVDEAQAEGCDAALREAGIIVRRIGGYGLPNALRITVPDTAGCDRVLAAIKGFLEP